MQRRTVLTTAFVTTLIFSLNFATAGNHLPDTGFDATVANGGESGPWQKYWWVGFHPFGGNNPEWWGDSAALYGGDPNLAGGIFSPGFGAPLGPSWESVEFLLTADVFPQANFLSELTIGITWQDAAQNNIGSESVTLDLTNPSLDPPGITRGEYNTIQMTAAAPPGAHYAVPEIQHAHTIDVNPSEQHWCYVDNVTLAVVGNLIENPGFEDNSGSLTPWVRFGQCQLVDSAGAPAHHIYWEADQIGATGQIYQSGFDAFPGNAYEISMHTAFEANWSGELEFGFVWLGGNGSTIIGESSTSAIPADLPVDYERFVFTATAPAGTVSVRPFVRYGNVTSLPNPVVETGAMTDNVIVRLVSGVPSVDGNLTIDLNDTHTTLRRIGGSWTFFINHAIRGVSNPGPFLTWQFYDTKMPLLRVRSFPDIEMTNDDDSPWTTDLSNFDWSTSKWSHLEQLLFLARLRNPELELYVQNYTPPIWLKSNNDRSGEGTLNTSYPDAYLEFGEHLWAQLRRLKSRGYDVKYLSLLNEPDWEHTQEGMMASEAMCVQIYTQTVDYIKDRVQNDNPEGVIMPIFVGVETIGPNRSYVNALKGNAAAWNNLDILAYHQYWGTLSDFQWMSSHGKPTWMSEDSRGIEEDLGGMLFQMDRRLEILQADIEGYVWWEIGHPSDWGGVISANWGVPAVRQKRFYAWQQFVNLTPMDDPTRRVTVNTSSGVNQLDHAAFVDPASCSATLHVLNEELTDSFVSLSLAGGQKIWKVEQWHTDANDDFAQQADPYEGEPTSQVPAQVNTQSLTTFRLYYLPTLADFNAILGCIDGPENSLDAACETIDYDADTDGDMHDLAEFQLICPGIS